MLGFSQFLFYNTNKCIVHYSHTYIRICISIYWFIRIYMHIHCISLKTMIACLFWGSLVFKKKSLTTVIVFSYLQWLSQWRHSLCSGFVSGDIPSKTRNFININMYVCMFQIKYNRTELWAKWQLPLFQFITPKTMYNKRLKSQSLARITINDLIKQKFFFREKW